MPNKGIFTHAIYIQDSLLSLLITCLVCNPDSHIYIFHSCPMYTPRSLFKPSVSPSVHVPTFSLGVVAYREIDCTIYVVQPAYLHLYHGASGQSHLQHTTVPFNVFARACVFGYACAHARARVCVCVQLHFELYIIRIIYRTLKKPRS